MSFSNRQFHREPVHVACLLLFAPMLLCALSIPLGAQDLPAFRQGLWEFHRTVGAGKVDVKKCTNPTEDMKKQNAMFQKSGCRISPVKKAGSTYTFISDCAITTPGGGTLNSHSTTVITVESDSAYKLQVDGTMNGQPNKETLVARRIGDCRN